MQQPITLSDDPRERVDQILLAIGTISIDLSGFDAVYLISGIQTLMTLPGFVDRTSIAGLRLQQFAERLQPHVYREPLIKQLIDDGWTAVEIARQAYEEIKLEAKTTLPKDLSGLKKVAKAAKLKNFSNMKKPALIEALKALPSDTLIAAIEQAK